MNWMRPLHKSQLRIRVRLTDVSPYIKLWVSESNANLSPIKLIRTHVLLSLSSSAPHHLFLLSIEKPGLARVVWKTEPNREGAYDTEYSFNNVDPSTFVSVEYSYAWLRGLPPSRVSSNSVHLQ